MGSANTVSADERRMLREALRATFYNAYGAAVGLLALYTVPVLLITALLYAARIGRPLVPPILRWVRRLSEFERARLRRIGYEVEAPYHDPDPGPEWTLRSLAADPDVRREMSWLFLQATWGLLLGLVAIQLPFTAVHDVTYPLWWYAVGPDEQGLLNGIVKARTWGAAVIGPVVGAAVFALWLIGAPKLLGLQTRPGRNFLGPDPDADLSERVARLTATRAAALDAHAVELRRIERALHDGAQNRIVGIAVLVGAARREVHRDPERADEILARAQDAAEQSLAELRAVVRSILPPVLENRGLEGALSALASDCAVPCKVTVEVPVRCPASVEATAYFVVAESLTNVAKHSGASCAEIEVRLRGDRLGVRVTDDGRGGADPAGGSGLAGIARRVEAHDGDVAVDSPVGGPTEIRVELPCGS